MTLSPPQVVYRACPDNPGHTIAVKQAWVESNLYGLRTAIKNFGIERFKKNCVKVTPIPVLSVCRHTVVFQATEGFNHVLEKFHHRQHDLRELGHVKMAEFQVGRWPQKSLIEHLVSRSRRTS